MAYRNYIRRPRNWENMQLQSFNSTPGNRLLVIILIYFILVGCLFVLCRLESATAANDVFCGVRSRELYYKWDFEKLTLI